MANKEEYVLHCTKSEIKVKRLVSQEVDTQVVYIIPRCDRDRRDVRESCWARGGHGAALRPSSALLC